MIRLSWTHRLKGLEHEPSLCYERNLESEALNRTASPTSKPGRIVSDAVSLSREQYEMNWWPYRSLLNAICVYRGIEIQVDIQPVFATNVQTYVLLNGHCPRKAYCSLPKGRRM